MPYIPSLDGLRAIAVVLVLAFHARMPGATGGFLGVDLFFVLSGYLITRLLAAEYARSGTIAVGEFYMRRLRRLWPALLALLAAYVVAAPVIYGDATTHLRDALVAALYLSDYGMALWRIPQFLQHTWSLSVEEHFYLLWPPVLLGIFKLPERRRIAALTALFVAATTWRWASYGESSWSMTYYRFDTRLSGLFLGSALGLAGLEARRWKLLLGLALFSYAAVESSWRYGPSLKYLMTFAELGAALMIVGAPLSRLLSAAPLAWVGRMSYGVYLWHYPVMYWLRQEGFDGWTTFALGAAFSLTASAISYYTVEARFRARSHVHPVMRHARAE